MQYSFANCLLDTESYAFSRDGEDVHVEPQVFDLLALLATRAGQLVTKDELIDVVWNGRIVSEATISARINAARAATGDTGKDQRVIRTVPRRGFEMVAQVATERAEAAVSSPAVAQTVRYVSSDDGTQIAYAVSGNGPPLMRAGHFLTHLERDWQESVFAPFIHEMSKHHRLLRYDQRGTGLSERDIGDLSLDGYLMDLGAVADAAGFDRFPIFAASQGVPIAVKFAALYPERVSHLVLYGGFALGRMKRGEGQAANEARALLTLMQMGWGKPGSPFMSAFTSLFCPDASRQERESLAETQFASATPEMALRIRQVIDQFDVTELLPNIVAPTLVLHASGDALHPVSQGRLLAATIPGAEFKQLESNNHIYLKSSPAWQEIVSATLEFVSRDE